MQIGAITSANQVWGATTRTLSSQANTMTAVQGRPSVATATILDLRPAAGVFREITVSNSTSTNNVTNGIYDGTNFDALSVTAGNPVASGSGNATAALSVRNASGGNIPIAYTGFDIS